MEGSTVTCLGLCIVCVCLNREPTQGVSDLLWITSARPAKAVPPPCAVRNSAQTGAAHFSEATAT